MKSKLFIIFFVFFVLFLFVKTTHAASNNNNAEIKLMQQQLLDAQSNAQIRNLYSIGVKMLKRMQIQNEQNAFNLDDCYERLGKFTRLMVVNNKRRALVTSNINKMENIYKDQSTEHEQQQQQQHQHQNLMSQNNNKNILITSNNNNNNNKLNADPQASFSLLNEINFYLAELENNYKIIQELRSKIEFMNRTRIQPPIAVASMPIDQQASYHAVANHVQYNNKSDIEHDCTMVSNVGFMQIQLSETNLNPNTQQKMGTFYKKQTVLCENQWLIIQQRINGFETNFNRSWVEYVTGFGSLRTDFWVGLELIAQVTQRRPHKLHIELTDWSDQIFIAQYERFEIGNEDDFYRLSLSSEYTGNASRDQIDDAYFGMLAQNGAYFSTYDNNKKAKYNSSSFQSPRVKSPLVSASNSKLTYQQQQQQIQQQQQLKNCALKSGGGWWFNNFSNCLPVNLNGMYVNGASAPSTRGIKWQAIRVQDRNYALKKSRMKIKPVY